MASICAPVCAPSLRKARRRMEGGVVAGVARINVMATGFCATEVDVYALERDDGWSRGR